MQRASVSRNATKVGRQATWRAVCLGTIGAALLWGGSAAAAGTDEGGGVWVVITHPVEDYATWEKGFEASGDMKKDHGWTGSEVYTVEGSANEVLVMEHFDTLENAQAFLSKPELKEAMEAAGVAGPPDIKFYRAATSTKP